MSERGTAEDINSGSKDRDLHTTGSHDLHSVVSINRPYHHEDRVKTLRMESRRLIIPMRQSYNAYDASPFLVEQPPYFAEEGVISIQSLQNVVATAPTRSDIYGSTPFTGSSGGISNPHDKNSDTASPMAPDMSGVGVSPNRALLPHQHFLSPSKRRKIGENSSFKWSGLGCGNRELNTIGDQHSEISLHNNEESSACNLSTLARAAAAAARVRKAGVKMSSTISEQDIYYEAEDANFLFRNDVQRCEAFISAIQACLKACVDHGRADAVARMARKLEELIDTLHIP